MDIAFNDLLKRIFMEQFPSIARAMDWTTT